MRQPATTRGHRHQQRRLALPRYRFGARWYDTLSGETVLYRRGRVAAIDLLHLHTGGRVLVIGCGTGLDLPHLRARVGTAGQIVGVDASPWMLHQATDRVARHGWANVTLLQADAAALPATAGDGFDAALFSYSLAVIGDWHHAWAGALTRLVDGGRVAVVDTDLPTRRAWPLRPLARFALWTGGVDRSRQVWHLVDQATGDTRHQTLLAGHIHVAAGTWNSPPD